MTEMYGIDDQVKTVLRTFTHTHAHTRVLDMWFNLVLHYIFTRITWTHHVNWCDLIHYLNGWYPRSITMGSFYTLYWKAWSTKQYSVSFMLFRVSVPRRESSSWCGLSQYNGSRVFKAYKVSYRVKYEYKKWFRESVNCAPESNW